MEVNAGVRGLGTNLDTYFYGMNLYDVLESLEPDDPRPLSTQIAERIREAIQQGRLKQGQRLPTINRLGGRYRTSPMVGRRAIQRVLSEGYAVIAPGTQGYFVCGATPTEAPDDRGETEAH